MLKKIKFSRWVQILIVAAIAIIGVGFFTNKSSVARNGDALGLQRIDLLYLNEPAPNLEKLKLKGTKAVIIFCASCRKPTVKGAKVIISNNPTVASHYALRRENGQIGPGYAVIDTRGYLRYRTFDNAINEHTREINRLVAGIK